MHDPVLEALWKKVVDEWDNDQVHGAFLRHCQEQQALPEAAARYKGMTGDRDRGAAAGKRLGAVALLAMASLEHAPRQDPRKGSRYVALGLSLLFLAGAIALLAAW